ncbi:GNAT family N-acetyltransferase [Paenibacillus solisilvae]|uniref:GNAT family N-acetyltransferase n=1 Tax=Paenibacillus solisilvae TaxID=2486751 RepID=A0ABW0W5B4_9BACL
MIDLKGYHHSGEVMNLLAECMWPDNERLENEYRNYRSDDSRILLGKMMNNQLVGLIGIALLSPGKAELKHISVKQGYRNQGLGKEMLEEIVEKLSLTELAAETDKDAVNFYRRTGFLITSLGEKYPGVERFCCVYRREEP